MRFVLIGVIVIILAIMLLALYSQLDIYYIKVVSLFIAVLSTIATLFFGVFGNYNHWSATSREQAKFEKELHAELMIGER